MPAERLSMRKIREVLRLSWAGRLSTREVAQSCAVGPTTVREYLKRAARAGLSWPLPAELTDSALEALLFPPAQAGTDAPRPVPDWAVVHDELRRGRHVTLQLLWEEYKQAHPTGYEYSRFCELYRQWRGKLPVWMRQEHRAGEKVFVDYAGMTMPVTDRETGQTRAAQIFVATLGASGYTFAEATWTQTLADFIMSHVRALEFFGGAPRIVVPDNLRTGVTHACRYDPDLNQTYQQWSLHYGTAILPTRVEKPRDKGKVEKGVQDVEQRILAALRHRTFFSLAELNEALAPLVESFNHRPFQVREGCRRSLFEELDRPALMALPATRYEYARWQKARVNLDYHVRIEDHHYSVPYHLAHEQVEARISACTIELFHNGLRVASHPRSPKKYQHTTQLDHMPENHRALAEWPPERVIDWVGKAGEAVAEVARRIIAGRAHPVQGYNACMGLKRLGDTHGIERLEAACQRALAIQSPSYKSVKVILSQGLDRKPLPPPAAPVTGSLPPHENVRGAEYYN